jgi:hypothetical protein
MTTHRPEEHVTLKSPPPAPRGLVARLAEDLAENGADVARALLSERLGESSRVRRGLDDERRMLLALAEDLNGVYGPGLLNSTIVRAAFDSAWSRAREGSREDTELMVAIGTALVGMKRRHATANLKAFENLMETNIRSIATLIGNDVTEALRYKDPVFLRERIQKSTRDGNRGEVNALTRLYERPEIVDLLVDARANRRKGPFPYRRLARAIVRPLEGDADAARKGRDRERHARSPRRLS